MKAACASPTGTLRRCATASPASGPKGASTGAQASSCSNEGFGTDPAHGTRKVCEAYYPDWEKCSPEGGRCSGLRPGEEVRYGTSAHRNFASKRASGVTYVDMH
jgi:hypothetical protein